MPHPPHPPQRPNAASSVARADGRVDGVGFDLAGARRTAAGGNGSAGHASAGRALGLFQARERLEGLGGRFETESAPGRDTRAVLSLTVAG